MSLKLGHIKIATKSERSAVDNAMLIAAIVYPITALPQLWVIYALHRVDGLSLLSWSGFALFSLIFACYGLVHRNKMIYLLQLAWLVIDVMVIIGILVYR